MLIIRVEVEGEHPREQEAHSHKGKAADLLKIDQELDRQGDMRQQTTSSRWDQQRDHWVVGVLLYYSILRD